MEIIKTNTIKKPPRIMIHAEHGVGKSSLAAAAPDPIFIQTEDGLDEIDTQALPMVETFEQAMLQLTWIYEGEHNFKTLVIDSIDWLETRIVEHVCREANKKSISEFSYGAGFQKVFDNFGRVVNALNAIREKRGMVIILIAHSQIKSYANPMGADYDRHQIKLRDKNAELFLEWCDLVGFMHFAIYTNVKDAGFGQEQVKAIGGSDRVLSCAPNAAYVSKNRYGIANDIPLPDAKTGWFNLEKSIRKEV